MSPVELNQFAKQVHSSMHRGIQPFHTDMDGDTLFAVTTDEIDLPTTPGSSRGRLSVNATALGARAASSFGAGFGGSVWALVPTADADAFAADWMDRYRASGTAPEGASALVTRPGAPGRRVDPVAG